MKQRKRTKFIPMELEALKNEFATSRELQIEFGAERNYLGFAQAVFSSDMLYNQIKNKLESQLNGIVKTRNAEHERTNGNKVTGNFSNSTSAEDLRRQIRRNEAEIHRIQNL